MLTAEKDGLIENTRLTCRNLDAAVVQSKQPGYFHYHKASAAVATLEASHAVPGKVKEIEAVEAQITHLRAEAEALRKSFSATMTAASSGSTTSLRPSTASVTTFSQWFSEYKRPSPAFGADSMKSKFVPSARIYGGSAHYEGFKSVATTMKPGKF